MAGMSGVGKPVNRRRRIVRAMVAVTAVMFALVAVIVGWWIWSVRQVWDKLDTAAEDFDVPPGFTEVARPRQGTAFCWVTCTHGGEAMVTMVFETEYTDPADACPALRRAVVELTGDATEGSYEDPCGWVGELPGPASLYAGAGYQQDFRANDGTRWTEAAAIPSTRVIAYVELNSGIE
jgi:hypothetical protein